MIIRTQGGWVGDGRFVRFVVHCHLGLGKLYGRAGSCAKAAEHLATALAMYREMSMDFYLVQAEAAIGSLPG